MAFAVTDKFKKRFISALLLAPLILLAIMVGGWAFAVMVGIAYILSVYEWVMMAKRLQNKINHMAFAVFYLTICFGAFYGLRLYFEHGGWLAIGVIMSVWASDTGAYIVGKKFGRRRMAPKLSPNKTWEGLFGAMSFSGAMLMIIAALYSAQFDEQVFTLTAYVTMFFGGCILGVVGQGGDLLVSYYKRRVGVKDTGSLIPGHGGILDRIDALLLVSPVFFIGVFICLM